MELAVFRWGLERRFYCFYYLATVCICIYDSGGYVGVVEFFKRDVVRIIWDFLGGGFRRVFVFFYFFFRDGRRSLFLYFRGCGGG